MYCILRIFQRSIYAGTDNRHSEHSVPSTFPRNYAPGADVGDYADVAEVGEVADDTPVAGAGGESGVNDVADKSWCK